MLMTMSSTSMPMPGTSHSARWRTPMASQRAFDTVLPRPPKPFTAWLICFPEIKAIIRTFLDASTAISLSMTCTEEWRCARPWRSAGRVLLATAHSAKPEFGAIALKDGNIDLFKWIVTFNIGRVLRNLPFDYLLRQVAKRDDPTLLAWLAAEYKIRTYTIFNRFYAIMTTEDAILCLDYTLEEMRANKVEVLPHAFTDILRAAIRSDKTEIMEWILRQEEEVGTLFDANSQRVLAVRDFLWTQGSHPLNQIVGALPSVRAIKVINENPIFKELRKSWNETQFVSWIIKHYDATTRDELIDAEHDLRENYLPYAIRANIEAAEEFEICQSWIDILNLMLTPSE